MGKEACVLFLCLPGPRDLLEPAQASQAKFLFELNGVRASISRPPHVARALPQLRATLLRLPVQRETCAASRRSGERRICGGFRRPAEVPYKSAAAGRWQ